MINAIGLKKSYGAGESHTEVIKGIDIKISDGDFVAILGASGSGKSTLLHALGGLDDIDEGRVVVAGPELDDVAAAKVVPPVEFGEPGGAAIGDEVGF